MERENRLLLLFIFIVVCALLGALYWVRTNTSLIKAPTYAATPSDDRTAAKLFEVPVLTDRKEQSTDLVKHMTYEVHFPDIALVERPELAKDANAVVSAFVHDSVNAFLKDADEAYSPDIANESSSDFSMRWSALLLSPTIISLRFDFSEYTAGAAHPNSGTRILNYDLEKHLLLQTPDLFASTSKALPFLSEFSRTALTTILADQPKYSFESEMAAGTEPTSSNFEQVGITKSGLLIVFSPYQVAPYARGTVQVDVPNADLVGTISERVSEAIRMATENIVEATPEGTTSSTQMEY